MSNLPKNFEKILLGAAGVAALGFAALGFLKGNAVSEDFSATVTGTGPGDATIHEALLTAQATTSLTTKREVVPARDGDRPVDLFVGIPLFKNRDNPNVPVDLLRGSEVHQGIPNVWWIETGADVSYANSPDRDDDGDGFSNREEFEAKTSPTDAKSVPALIAKLVYVKDESTKWYVQFGLDSDGNWAPKFVAQTPSGEKLQNRVSPISMLKPGEVFFAEGAFAKRFKFVGITQREVVSERTKMAQQVKFAQYEDLKPNKPGTKYESQQGLPDAQLDASAYYDRTAVLELKAIGNEGREFKIEEGTKFALPPNAKEKNYLMKAVSPESITVEVTKPDGTTETVEISKGGQ